MAAGVRLKVERKEKCQQLRYMHLFIYLSLFIFIFPKWKSEQKRIA